MVEPTSFFHVALKVPDVDEAVAFYRDHLGGELLEHERADAGDTGPAAVEHAALSVGDKRLYVFDRAPYEAAGHVDDLPYGFLHVGYVVPDVEAAATALETDVTFVMGPTVFGALRIAFFEGPAGERIELIEHLD